MHSVKPFRYCTSFINLFKLIITSNEMVSILGKTYNNKYFYMYNNIYLLYFNKKMYVSYKPWLKKTLFFNFAHRTWI